MYKKLILNNCLTFCKYIFNITFIMTKNKAIHKYASQNLGFFVLYYLRSPEKLIQFSKKIFYFLYFSTFLVSELTQSLASSVCGAVAEMRPIHMDYQVQWRKRDGMSTFSRGECLGAPGPLSQEESRECTTLASTGFYWLNLHRIQGVYK